MIEIRSFGFCGRREAHERGHVVRLRVLVGDRVDLVRRAGLARQRVALDRRDLRGGAARRQDALEHGAQRRGGRGGHDPARRELGSAAAVDATHEMRRAQDAAVGDRAVELGDLHRRDRLALADREVAHRGARVVLELRDDALLLAREVGAGELAEAELADVVVKALLAEPLTDHDRADVVGLGQDVARGHRGPATLLGVLDRAVGDDDLRRQVEGGARA